jgi:hypothetical protein
MRRRAQELVQKIRALQALVPGLELLSSPLDRGSSSLDVGRTKTETQGDSGGA